MSISEQQKNSFQTTVSSEVEQLKTRVIALEQLLEVYEKETVEKSQKLEQTLADLHHHTQRLTHAESTLATLRSMLNSMGDAVVVIDQEGNFLFLNPSAENLLGTNQTNSSLQSWAEAWNVYLPDQTTAYPFEDFPLVRAMRGESPETTEIFVPSSQADRGNWFSVTVRSLDDQEGKIRGGVAVFHNITGLKHSEIALRQSETHSREQAAQLQRALYDLQTTQAQLVQTEKMSSLGQLVAGLAHEINNPVNFIYGNLNPARNYVEDLLGLVTLYQAHHPTPHPEVQEEAEVMDLEFVMEDLPKLLTSMKVGADRIKGIVSSMRTFCRMDEAEMRQVNIHDCLESTLMILRSRLKLKHDGPAIEVMRNYSDLPLVECFAGQLNQVFMNILSNAIDALEETYAGQSIETLTPSIAIHTHLTDDAQVVIRIQDNGPGIPKTALDQLFAPFFTTKPIGKGTGIGLSISHQIVTEKHRGCLTCDSEVGKGTTFIIKIPLNQEA